MTAPLALDVRGLHKRFGPVHAVQDLHLQVAPGEIYVLVGPDGAGKTTTLRLLCGALRADAGHISILGHDLQRDPDRARDELGYLSQRFSLYEELTVLENLRFFAEVRGVPQQQWFRRSMEILEFVGLAPFVHRRAGHLSGGMKQKLGLATALVHTPRVLLLDEPTNGVDPITRQEFWQLILRLAHQEGVAALVTTSYMDEAVRGHRVGFMQQGRLFMEGPPDELRGRFPYRVLAVRGEPLRAWRDAARELPGVHDAQLFGDRLHLWVEPGQARTVGRALQRVAQARGWTRPQVRAVDPTLEDVFLAHAPRGFATPGRRAAPA